MLDENWLRPDWPAPPNVHAFSTTRGGGVSQPPYASLNLGRHVADDPVAVAGNRARLRAALPAEPLWLRQVHGTQVAEASQVQAGERTAADAIVSRAPGKVCVIMTADCLPVLLADRSGRVVGAAHAGWRGLCDGVLEATVARMQVPAGEIMAWLGPAIGPRAFEVGDEVRAAFVQHTAAAAEGFVAHTPGKWLADLYLLARQRLAGAGVVDVYGGGGCTYSDATRFFSYRRDGETGRMGTLIWRD